MSKGNRSGGAAATGLVSWLGSALDGLGELDSLKVHATATVDGDLRAHQDFEDSEDAWLKTIWNAIEFELSAATETDETDDTVEVMPPENEIMSPAERSQAAALSSIVTWEYEELSPRPLLDYPLHISSKDPRELGTCVACKKEVAVIVLHDHSPQHNEPRLADITCVRCSLGLQDTNTPIKATIRQSVPWSRKRRAPSAASKVWCDLCSHLIGTGGMRMLSDRDSGWHDPDFRVEYMCVDCVRNFDNCTKCGGQGTYRVGKWRPRQLFERSKRNCVLVHEADRKAIRKGSKFQALTFRLPPLRSEFESWDPNIVASGDEPSHLGPYADLSPSARLAALIQDGQANMNFGAIDGSCAIATMRMYPHLWTWERALKMVASIRSLSESFFRGDETPQLHTDASWKYAEFGYLYRPGSDSKQEVRLLISCNLWYLFHTDRHVRFTSLSSDGGPSCYKRECNIIIARIEEDCRINGFLEPEFFWLSTGRPVHINTPEEEVKYTNIGFMTLRGYAKHRNCDIEELRTLLRRTFRHVDDPNRLVMVVPWEFRFRMGEFTS